MALAVADEGLVLDSGELVAAGSASDLVDNAEVEELYMGASSLPTDRESRHEVDPE
jgi:ABC-type branched-subunit amino acid transport system ATPase component